jgi:hypothetical protein
VFLDVTLDNFPKVVFKVLLAQNANHNGDCMQHIDQPRMLNTLYMIEVYTWYPVPVKLCDDELLGTGTKNTYVNTPQNNSE